MARHPVKRTPPDEDLFEAPKDDAVVADLFSVDLREGSGPLDRERIEAAAQVAAFAKRGGGNRRKGLKATAAAERTRAVLSARARVDSGDWKDAPAGELVALFALIHEEVYGVADADLSGSGKEWALASVGAARLRDEEFAGEADRLVAYLRWFGAREMGAEQWRRNNGRTGRRVGWRLVFSKRLLTDYRVDLARGVTR